MLDTLRALLSDSLPSVPPMDAPTTPDDIRVAACTMFLEVAYADGTMSADERRTIVRTLVRHFGVDERGAEELFAAAESQIGMGTSEGELTRQLVAEYDQDQRITLAEMLREIASADGWVDEREERLLSSMASWLGVSSGPPGAQAS